MKSVFKTIGRKIVKGKEEIRFSSFSSYHLIEVTVRVKGKKQLSDAGTDDEDLAVEIDGARFTDLKDKSKYFNSPASFSGGTLHNLSKTVYFITFLRGRNHHISLVTDDPPGTATLEELEVSVLSLDEKFTLDLTKRAEDGDRRPWITFVLVDLALKLFTASLDLKRRFVDSDDVKVLVDGEIKRNHRSLLHKFWYFIASRFTGESQSDSFVVDFPSGIHYLEFYSDRMPVFKSMLFNFGLKPALPISIPTADNPQWTKSFYDDPPAILLARIIFGESRNQPAETKLGVGWSVKNRVGKGQLIDPTKTYNDLYDVILDDGQYNSLTDPKVRPRLEDPLNTQDPIEIRAWKESYKIATEVVNNEVSDPTGGALFFHDDSMTTEDFLIRVPRAVYIKQIGRILFYGLKS